MISCRRPSNRSSRLALPLGPSNLYSFSTAIHGIRRRSAANASRAWVNSFSFTSSFSRAASHPFSDTISGCFIWSFFFSTSLVFILILLCLYSFGTLIKFVEDQPGHSSAGRRSGGHDSNVCDAYRTHESGLFFSAGGLVRFLQISRQPIERPLPEPSILLDPLRGFFQRFCVELHFMHAAMTSAAQQPGLFENAQMF